MTTAPTTDLELEDLLAMSSAQLQAIMDANRPIDWDSLVGHQFLGTDLSMPRIGRRLLWQTFRKTLVRDEVHGDVRGWNVRMEQRGLYGAQVPMRHRDGSAKSFAHYRVRPNDGRRWPKGWAGDHFFDYTIAGNAPLEALTTTPVVAVNEGSSDLILGWEIFRVAGRSLAPPLYWAIRKDGPIEEMADPKHTPHL